MQVSFQNVLAVERSAAHDVAMIQGVNVRIGGAVRIVVEKGVRRIDNLEFFTKDSIEKIQVLHHRANPRTGTEKGIELSHRIEHFAPDRHVRANQKQKELIPRFDERPLGEVPDSYRPVLLVKKLDSTSEHAQRSVGSKFPLNRGQPRLSGNLLPTLL